MPDKIPISWKELVKATKEETPELHFTKLLKDAGKVWKTIKAGNHPKYSQRTSQALTRKKGKKQPMVTIKPGHKGAPSKTRPGKLDYVTHEGDEFYHRDSKLEDETVAGVKGKPYMKRKTRKKRKTKKSPCKSCTKYKKVIQELKSIISEQKQ